MDQKQALELLTSIPAADLAKAVKDAKGLEGIRIIKDLWEDYGAIPDRNDTKTGPAMHSSGSGADKAIAEYSNPAPQVGITEQYQKFTEQNIEGWGKMHSAFKSMNDTLTTGFGALTELLSKAEEEKKEEKKEEEKKEEHKAEGEMHEGHEGHESKHPAAECKGHGKSLSEKLASIWEQLGELEEAYGKADTTDANVESMIVNAESHLEAAEATPASGNQEAMKAIVSINTGWNSLAKATGLSRYDLHGYGNQEDAQVPGDSTSDQSKKDLKAAKAKAAYFTSKSDRMEKALGLKKADEEKKEEKKEEEHKMEEKKSDAPTPPVAEVKSEEIEALKAQVTKNEEFMKSVNERIAFLQKRQEEVTGNKAPTMLPIILKSGGIKTDDVASTLNDRVESAVESGELTDDGAGMARNLISRYQAAGKGHITTDMVNQQLRLAPLEVQNFFQSFEQTA